MKKLILFLGFLSVFVVSLSGQGCYESTRGKGIAAFNDKQYSDAMAQFVAAKDCPDKPLQNDLDEWIAKCRSAIDASSRRAAEGQEVQRQQEEQRRQEEARQQEEQRRQEEEQRRQEEARRQEEQRRQEEAARREREKEARRREEAGMERGDAWQQAERKGYIEVRDVVFANVDPSGEIIGDYGSHLYASEIRYLKPMVHYDGALPGYKRVYFDTRLYGPDGNRLYSMKNDYIDAYPGKGQTFEMYLLGDGSEGSFEPGEYRYEIWYNGRVFHVKTFSLYRHPGESSFLTVDGKGVVFASFPVNGGEQTFQVSTDASEWTLWGVPSFCQVVEKTAGSFTLRCNGNSGSERKIYMKVKTRNDEVPIHISQEEARGTLSVSANVPDVDISVSGNSLSNKFVGKTPLLYGLPPGSYTVYAEKDGYRDVPSRSVRIATNQKSHLYFQLKKDRWISRRENCAFHFFEPKYGYGFDFTDNLVSRHYVGFNYAYIRAHMGFYTSAMYGLDHKDVSLSMGPVLRLTRGWQSVDFQLYAGPGVRYDRNTEVVDPIFKKSEWHLMGEAGFRMNFEDANQGGDFSWASLSLGCQFSKGMAIPTAGLSLFPVAFAMADAEEDFSRHFLDVLGGYDLEYGEIFLGGSYSWVKTHLGFYTSFLIGFQGGWSASVAPLFRLTKDGCALDLQVYAGPAMMDMEFAGDMGLRFAWRGGTALSLWDFAFGCQVSGSRIVPTFSVGIGIPLVIGTCGAAFAFL